MRETLLKILRCPRCSAEQRFEATAGERSDRELVEGSVTCLACGHVARISRGVLDMLPDPPAHIRAEAAGLERFAEVMRSDGWDRDRILALPDDPLPYWQGQKLALERLLERVSLAPGGLLVDIGANTCWASASFARRGLEVIALDIATAQMQGLHTAEWWFAAQDIHFERILSSMTAPALASSSVDYVFASQVLHHNGKADLGRTFRELHRILRPGGLLMAINEPLRFVTNRKRDHGEDVRSFEGNEHVYFSWEYTRAARRAGFGVELLPPPWPAFTGAALVGSSAARNAGVAALRRSGLGRRALHRKALVFGPDHSLFMLCRKRS